MELKLGDICEIIVGGDIDKNNFSEIKTEEFNTPILTNGIGENALRGFTDKAVINVPSVTVSARGTIGYSEYRDYPYFPAIRLICLIPNEDLDTKYLSYFLKTVTFNLAGGSIKQLTAPMVKKITINLPPLKEQRLIASILDLFTNLITLIDKEIELRKKQFEYYSYYIYSQTMKK